jgi:hypothetical protein
MNPVRLLWVGCLSALALAPCAAARAEESPGYKSPKRAFLYSFLGTVVPVGGALIAGQQSNSGSAPGIIGIGGAVIGPSFGHFYAQRPGRAWLGIGVRAAAVGGLVLAISSALQGEDSGSTDLLAVLSFATGTGMAAYDIAKAPGSAKSHNAELQAVRMTVSPTLLGAAKVPGVRVDVRF